ncbi:MAG: hypothetical protein WCI18_06720 [Pseudomonadota bacterium]
MMRLKGIVFHMSLLCICCQSYAAEVASKNEGKQNGSFQFQATQSKLRSTKAVYLDSGTISHILDLGLTSVHDGSYLSIFGTAGSWQPEDAKLTEYKFDSAGFLAGFYRRRDVNGNALSLGVFGGGYYPMEWSPEFSSFYQIPRFDLGASLGLNVSIIEIEGKYDYFWPLKKEGKIKVDSTSTSLQPQEYAHFSVESRFSLMDLLYPELTYGTFHLSGAKLVGPFSEKNFNKASVSYLSAGLAVRPLGNLLSIKIKSNRVFGNADDRGVEYATGRRAISELTNSYSLSFTGSL